MKELYVNPWGGLIDVKYSISATHFMQKMELLEYLIFYLMATDRIMSENYEEYAADSIEYIKSFGPKFEERFEHIIEQKVDKLILETQAGIQAGLGKFSDLPAIVNKSWFGSSLHDPCLQIADWVAYAVRIWAERCSPKIKLLMPHFRGYPDLDNIIGKGIVLCPKKECFPKLELKDSVEVKHEY